MRTDREFISSYREGLKAANPSASELDPRTVRPLALTELCLHFLASHLPDEDVSAVPYLMLGYPKLLGGAGRDPAARRALGTMRHLCSRYGSVAAWSDACRGHGEHPETMRCYDIAEGKPRLRNAAPTGLRALLDEQLGSTVPWIERRLSPAEPGEARAKVGDTILAYLIPPVTEEQKSVRQHKLADRVDPAPIRISLDEMKWAAKRVDEREEREDWPSSLAPLRLSERLDKLSIKGLAKGFFEGEGITLEGAVHVLGMLSSGKSTLVWAIVFALAIGRTNKRIAMLVNDTIQGATIVARLRRHGIKATVLSSRENRDRHLDSIHRQQRWSSHGWALDSLGEIAENFSIACPLDGSQKEPRVIQGEADDAEFPKSKDKPCHKLVQKPERARQVREDYTGEDVEAGPKRDCPLWARCPAQDQQRSAVDAQVVAMTPQAFVHMTPDEWTTPHNATIAELVQCSFDLVIIDEVDSVQRTMDEIFAPPSPIMGGHQNDYAPAVGTRTSEALRELSGLQFRRKVNARWQSNFHTLFRLIGVLYAMLQNERADLGPFGKVVYNTPFTAGGILFDLWRRRQEVRGLTKPGRSFDDPAVEDEFLEVVKVAAGISRFSRTSAVSSEQRLDGEDQKGDEFRIGSFQKACDSLQRIAREVFVADDYADLVEDIEIALDGDLAVFRAECDEGHKRALAKRTNALALLLAVVTELAVSHYYWLVKTQPAVASDFKIEDQVFSQASNLLKHYRTLLPANPAGAVFGLLYDEPTPDKRNTRGGKLTLINHLGVGRHLIVHLHDLLASEGRAGPHVLMLSGTSWAGGTMREPHPKTGKPMDTASPTFDVQVPAKGILLQPQPELAAIGKSRFELVEMRNGEGKQIRVSGQPERERRRNLALIAARLAVRRDGANTIERHWRQMSDAWGAGEVAGRRRSVLVTNSYADAAVVADALVETLEGHGGGDWKVYCVVRDGGDDLTSSEAQGPRRARELPRSLIERFGNETEMSILVAPVQIVSRGHNILNRGNRAAVSSIYFLHRPHPRPDDLAPTIGRLNRFAVEHCESGPDEAPSERASRRLSQRARAMRHAATNLVRYSLYSRGGYSELSTQFKSQFAWDMLTPLWQTVGRGIRNGCPVFVGFVDRQFAPESFDGGQDTGHTSALVQAMKQLKRAMDPELNPSAHEVARLLYEPFHTALSNTKGLNHE